MRDRVWGVAMGAAVLLFGVGALLDNFGVVEIGFGLLWPVFVIAAGLAMVFGRTWCGEESSD